MPQDKVTLKIPRPLYEKIRLTLDGSGFSSVNEFVVYVLRDLMSMEKQSADMLSKKEIETIRDKLKSLGYF